MNSNAARQKAYRLRQKTKGKNKRLNLYLDTKVYNILEVVSEYGSMTKKQTLEFLIAQYEMLQE